MDRKMSLPKTSKEPKTRDRPPKIPTAAQKRTAAACFRGWNEDDIDSPTESESEAERQSRYPNKRKPSPRKSSRHMRQQLRQVSSRASGKKALKAEMDDENRGMALRTRSAVAEREREKATSLDAMPRVLAQVAGADDDESKPGSGQVFVDGAGLSKMQRIMMVRRAIIAQTEADSNTSNIPKSDMGLFASLPGELRNRIYRFALVEGDRKPFTVTMEPETCNLGACIHMRLPTALPGILSTCAQIRAEAMPIFIAENSFKFDAEVVKARCVANWLRVIGHYGCLLSKVVLDVVSWEVPANLRMTSTAKMGVHYEMTLRWKTWPSDRWSLMVDEGIRSKASKEVEVLEGYVWTLNEEIGKGKAKEEVLRAFVWSDWLANCVYLCRK